MTRHAQTGEAGAEVACGDCTACCTSSYFIHIGPDERETLWRIPAGFVPSNSAQLAALAISVYEVFLEYTVEQGMIERTAPDAEIARAVLAGAEIDGA